MPFDPSTAEMEQAVQQSQRQTPGFDPQTAQMDSATPSPTSGSSLSDNSALSSVTPNAQAFMSGARNELAGMAGNVTGSQKVTDALSDQSPETQQNAEQNPYSSAAGAITGAVGGTAAAIGASGEALGALGVTGLLNTVGANAITGAALAGTGNKLLGSAIGSATALAGSVITSTANFVAKSSLIQSITKDFIGKVNGLIDGTPGEVAAKSQANVWTAAANNEKTLFQSFRDVSGVNAGETAQAAAKFLSNNADELTPTQQKIITQYMNRNATADSMGQLHDARKALAFDFSKFDKENVSESMYTDFRNLQKTGDSVMSQNAENLGVGSEFKLANTYYQAQIMPLINAGAKDTFDALNNTITLNNDMVVNGKMMPAGSVINKQPLDAAKITDNLIQKNINPDKPAIAKQFLDTLDPTGRSAIEVQMVNKAVQKATQKTGAIDFLGLKTNLQNMTDKLPGVFSKGTTDMISGLNNTIDEASTVLGVRVTPGTTGVKRAVYGALGTTAIAGGAIGGYQQEGLQGVVPGAALGLSAAAMGLGLNKLVSTQMGQTLLRHASGPAGQAIGKSIIQSILLQGALQANQYRQNQGQ